ncbi:hypothetical protein [uncultured Tenacibaculum sp.]|uniref:hypothetical protein n=1 Tax=uncultured Tenacibaculum sp. TaxID=174713 RepID=UPI00260F143C|nr:hypothetical protein [uncultured Tenacibaculum sp.]
MSIIKNIFFPLSILLFMSCASYQFEKQPPFKIISGTYTNWVGGVRGVSGTNINIVYSSNQEVEFDSIFYKDRKTKVSYKKNGSETSLLGQFRNETEDFQLQRSAQLEYGNSLPNDKKKKIDNPFKLDGNEVVISYKENNEIKYFKYSNLTEGEQVLYK